MPSSHRLWRDRRDAGQALARRFEDQRAEGDSTILVALPRGGVPVAAAMAERLQLPVVTWAVRKLARTWEPEVAVGAIAPGGVVLWAEDPAGPGAEERSELVAAERQELERRQLRFGDPAPIHLAGRHLIVVDDGIATGMTTRAALLSLRSTGPASLSLAVPVVDQSLLPMLHTLVDRLEVLRAVPRLRSVGEWYERFDQLDDEQVLTLLEGVRRGTTSSDEPLWALRPSHRT